MTTARKRAAVQPTDEQQTPVPMFTGSVTDSDKPPSGYYWDWLEEANSAADLNELLDELERHRYSKDGQIYTAVTAKLSQVGGGKTRRGR